MTQTYDTCDNFKIGESLDPCHNRNEKVIQKLAFSFTNPRNRKYTINESDIIKIQKLCSNCPLFSKKE